MFLSRRAFLRLTAASPIALLPACKSDSGKIKIGVVTNNPEDFWTICEKGATVAAKENDVELLFRRPDKGDAAIQLNIVKELVAQGVKGVAVSVIDPKEQAPELKNIAAQTNLFTMDNDAEGSDRLCYIGTDNYEAGKAVGRLVKEVMPNGGSIAIFVGQITPINARLRFQGVVDELAGKKDATGPTFGKYTLFRNEAITDDAKRAICVDNAKDALEKMKGAGEIGMVGLWAYNAPAILEAAKSKEMLSKVKIVSFDEYPDTLTAIQAGEIYATVVQDPYNFGFKSVELLAKIAKTGDKSIATSNPIQNIPYRIVAKEAGKDRLDAKAFEAELKRLMGK